MKDDRGGRRNNLRHGLGLGCPRLLRRGDLLLGRCRHLLARQQLCPHRVDARADPNAVPEDVAGPRGQGVDRAEARHPRRVLAVRIEELHEVLHDVRLREYVAIVPVGGSYGGKYRGGIRMGARWVASYRHPESDLKKAIASRGGAGRDAHLGSEVSSFSFDAASRRVASSRSSSATGATTFSRGVSSAPSSSAIALVALGRARAPRSQMAILLQWEN